MTLTLFQFVSFFPVYSLSAKDFHRYSFRLSTIRLVGLWTRLSSNHQFCYCGGFLWASLWIISKREHFLWKLNLKKKWKLAWMNFSRLIYFYGNFQSERIWWLDNDDISRSSRTYIWWILHKLGKSNSSTTWKGPLKAPVIKSVSPF